MPGPEKSLRQQLLEARADLMRQIAILQLNASGKGGAPRPSALAVRLTSLLREIEAQPAELDADDT